MTTTAAKPAKVRTLAFDAMTRVLVVTEGSRRDAYHLHDVPAADAGHARFRFVKHADGVKYTVTLTDGGVCFCDCPAGFRGKPCRHASALVKLVSLGRIVAPAAQ